MPSKILYKLLLASRFLWIGELAELEELLLCLSHFLLESFNICALDVAWFELDFAEMRFKVMLDHFPEAPSV